MNRLTKKINGKINETLMLTKARSAEKTLRYALRA